jgi:hypothetical protein
MIGKKIMKRPLFFPSNIIEGGLSIGNKICGGKNNSFLLKRSNFSSTKYRQIVKINM